MTKATLPHTDSCCADLVLEVLAAASSPLTLREIAAAVRAKVPLPVAEIRAAVFELEADELVDCEKFPSFPKLAYFLMHRAPFGARWIPSHQVKPFAGIAQNQWFSPLGLAA
jgi:hypothetical protein